MLALRLSMALFLSVFGFLFMPNRAHAAARRWPIDERCRNTLQDAVRSWQREREGRRFASGPVVGEGDAQPLVRDAPMDPRNRLARVVLY